MRVAVIADTHLPRGSRRLPDECLAELEAADLILHAGDVVSAEVFHELEDLAPVEAVFGNMDEAALKSLLPRRRVVEVEGARVGMVHTPGPEARRHERLVEWFPGCDAVVYGHTHVPEVEERNGVWVMNPGSPTERRRAPMRAMIRLEVAAGTLRPRLLDLGT